MKNIKILLPSSWTNYPADNSIDEHFDDAEFKILQENPAYGDNPYTVQVIPEDSYINISNLSTIFRPETAETLVTTLISHLGL